MRDWADFHVEPLKIEDDDEDKTPHRRAIWRGMDLTTMHNDEVHGVKNEAGKVIDNTKRPR
jgi:hypothetical protein